ncbi:MAG: hypothetical protein J4N99_06695, partial [Chloroflexi bacterium]|nr:hypothetical protein [Chloroflexota bacterium]
MDQLERRAVEILEGLAAQPAAPFFEERPARFILETLANLKGVETRRDQFGNVIAHYRNLASDAAPRPPIAFMAHMDHPGFEIFLDTEQKNIYTA